MKRFTISVLFVGLLAASWILGYEDATSAAPASHDGKVSGQGKMKFKVLYTSSHFARRGAEGVEGRPRRIRD